MLDKLKEALTGTGIPFAEMAWDKKPDSDYGVYALDGQSGSVWADGHMRDQALEGTVDVFSRTGGVSIINLIQAALNAVDGLSWYLNSIQYESDTRLIHYEWVFSFVATRG